MKKEYADKWIAALRSGQYPKGRSALASRDNKDEPFSFCCLGVACEIFGKVRQETTFMRYYETTTHKGGECAILPHQLMLEMGMKRQTGIFPKELAAHIEIPLNEGGNRLIEEITSLTNLNDYVFLDSFEPIADFIEQNWEHL